jgi:SAM-dependent methyltransferase
VALRLNLGCGKRCFGGEEWVNVDIDDECLVSGVKYLKADITKTLPFEDDSADEILTVHVIEHLWPWDVEAVLKDWIRVLKPGGSLVTECPDLDGACRMLVGANQQMNAEVWRLAMFAIYGDPKFRSLEHRHKWGYTDRTLISLLKGLGLNNVRREPAQFKMKEPRDMRIVAEK